MKRKVFQVLLGLMLSVGFAFGQKKEMAPAPNIILILADDLGYGDIKALNPDSKIETPHLDRLAKEGIAFTNAHASASVCTPSRYGLLTGRYAFRTQSAAFGIGGFDRPVIENDRETLASLLKKSGYFTAVVGKWHLGLDWQTKDGLPAKLDPKTGFSNVDYSKPIVKGPNSFGFDYSFIHPASLDIPPYVFLKNHKVIDPEVVLTTSVYPAKKEGTRYAWDKKHTDSLAVYWEKGIWWRQGEMSKSFRVEDCQSNLVNAGVEFIQDHLKARANQPFFLYLPLTGPHTPWMPTEKFRGKSKIGLYGDFVMETDEIVARLREVLRENGILENTLVIFTSDNGAYWPQEEIELHQHRSNDLSRGQKGDVWDGGHRIPLIVSWPERIKGNVGYNELVSLTDVFATLAELQDIELAENQGQDSESFLGSLLNQVKESVRKQMIHHSSGNMYAIRTREWKFVDGLGSGGFTSPSRVQPERNGPSGQLYHLVSDRGEENNVFLNYPEKVAELRELMRKIRDED